MKNFLEWSRRQLRTMAQNHAEEASVVFVYILLGVRVVLACLNAARICKVCAAL